MTIIEEQRLFRALRVLLMSAAQNPDLPRWAWNEAVELEIKFREMTGGKVE